MSMPRARAELLWVLVSAAAVRLAVVAWAWGRFPPAADGSYYHRLASRLAEGEGYTWLWPDGAVTHAAHYPVGYPAMVALLYAVVAAWPGLAMLLNAALGTLAAVAVQQVLGRWTSRLGLMAGLAVAFHPALVMYTPALMTEGVAASLLACALWATVSARAASGRSGWWMLAVTGGVLGLATLVRPQCLLMAPVLGLLGRRTKPARLPAALLVTAVALCAVLPWTLRNCRRMDRCALVSVNGGWNLLIGTQPEGRGGWSELRVPEGCREVFDEAGKDRCFERAAWRRIRDAPAAWASLAAGKLAVTFDYCGAAGWYLHSSSPEAFGERDKLVLGIVETIYLRLLLLFAMVAALPRLPRWRSLDLRDGIYLAIAVAGLGAAFTRHAWITHLALVVALALRGRGLLRGPALYGAVLGLVASVAAVHAVFFGAGRYQLLVMPLVAALAPLGLLRVRGRFRGACESAGA